MVILYLSFRGIALDFMIGKVKEKLARDYAFNLTMDESHFSGMSKINMHGIKLSRINSSALFEADSLSVEPSLAALLIGEVRINSFYLSNAELSLICEGKNCNYQSLVKSDQKKEVKKIPAEKNYASFLNRVLRRAFNVAPQTAEVKNFRFRYVNDSINETISVPYYRASETELSGTVKDESNGFEWKWAGAFSQSAETFDLTFYPLSEKAQNLPLLKSIFKMDCSLDTMHVALYDLLYSKGKLDLKGHFSAENLKINHARISDDTVKFVHLLFDSKVTVSSNAIALDSSSIVELNSIYIKPFFRLEKGKSVIADIKIHIEPTHVTDFFYSLPVGMFEEVRDVEGEGMLEYVLDFHLDSAQPDSVIFNSSLKKSRLHLNKFGDGNLLKINRPFIHNVYERDRLVRSYEVGPGNPAFTPLDSVSPLFRSSVLTSEDGNFFYHSGFNEDAFRKSIATNFKAGRFQRGGSTISMQLVKNVYLTRKKTIARKAEEALIVWLLETNRLVSKARMFEVYLNIIELGPGIYGIGEAAPFYFGKRPSELNLAESIFLAHLLPHPKWYKSSFNDQGHLEPHMVDYYRIMSNFMLKKNLITQQQFDELKPDVVLNGPARDLIIKYDSTLNFIGPDSKNLGF